MRSRMLVAIGVSVALLTAACGAGDDRAESPGDTGPGDVESVRALSDADAAEAARAVNATDTVLFLGTVEDPRG